MLKAIAIMIMNFSEISPSVEVILPLLIIEINCVIIRVGNDRLSEEVFTVTLTQDFKIR